MIKKSNNKDEDDGTFRMLEIAVDEIEKKKK